jgi:hypothetical protein
MRRASSLALLVLLALPALSRAQERVPPARLTVAPVFGIRQSLLRSQRTTVVVPSALLPAVVEVDPDREAGGVAGVEADLRLLGPIGLSAGALYSDGDPFGILLQADEGVLAQLSVAGPTVWFYHADLSFRLPDVKVDAEGPAPRAIPAGYLVFGAALVRQDFEGTALSLPGEDVAEHRGLHVGYRAQFPVGVPRLALQASVEDYVVVWDRALERARLQRAVELQTGRVLSAGSAFGRTHIPMLNVGLALRL